MRRMHYRRAPTKCLMGSCVSRGPAVVRRALLGPQRVGVWHNWSVSTPGYCELGQPRNPLVVDRPTSSECSLASKEAKKGAVGM